MNCLDKSNSYTNQNPKMSGHQSPFIIDDERNGSVLSSTTAPASHFLDSSDNDEAMNDDGTTLVTAEPTATETSTQNNRHKELASSFSSRRLSSVADVEEDDTNGLQRRSSISSRRSSASWPGQTPDPLCTMAQYSAEGIHDHLSASSPQHRDLIMPQTANEFIGAASGREGEDKFVRLQQPEALLFDPPHTSYIPASYKSPHKTHCHDEGSTVCKHSVDVQTKEQSRLNEGDEEQLKRHPSSLLQYHNGRRRSSFDLGDLDATILFVDLEGYSKTTNLTQRHITRAFMNTLSCLLTFCYGSLPLRMNVKDYVILPTGDGAAVVVIRPPLRRTLHATDNDDDDDCCGNDEVATAVNVVADRLSQSSISSSNSGKQLFGLHCSSCSRISLQTTEETALWLGSSLLLWSESIQIGLRVGLNSGELSIVEDPYGDPNVCGDAINMANRIMDTALPGQILASAGTVVKKLGYMQQTCDNFGCVCSKCPNMKCEIASQPSEVVVKHGVTTNVQSITVELYPLPQEPEAVGDDTGLDDRSTSEETDSAVKRKRSLSISAQIPAHPLAEIKSIPRKQSFASLSSLQPPSSTGSPNKQDHLRSKSLVLPNNDAIALKRSIIGSQNTTKEATSPTATNSTSNTTKSNDSNIASSTAAERRSTSTTLESTQIAASPQLPFLIGNHKTPVTKWYMKVKPTEMTADSGRIKPKVLPQELIRRHHKIAFIGIMHDNLSKAFINILEVDPQHRWDEVFVLFPSDECLKNSLVQNYSMLPVEKLIENKHACRSSLHQLLSPVVRDLRFLQYDQLMHCGSYWDWCDPGGFIHVSPLTWGQNPKTCPAMNYYWNSKIPSPEYRVYREGLGYLLKVATPF